MDLCKVLREGTVPSDIEAVLPPDGELPTISPDFGRALFRLVAALKPRSILEFGAGSSSLVLSLALRHIGGGRLTSVEHAPKFSAASWNRVEETGIDALLIHAPLALRLHSQGLLYQYRGLDRLTSRGPFDFVLVDAPPGVYGRDATLYQALPHLNPGSFLLLDDAARVQDGTVINRWRRACDSLDIVCWDKQFARGVALLRFNGPRPLKLSARTIAGTLHDRLVFRKWVRVSRRNEA